MAGAVAVARQAPGFAGLWVVNADTSDQVLNVAFTAGLGSARGGVTANLGRRTLRRAHNRTLLELRTIQGEFSAAGGAPFGLHLLAVRVDESRNHLELRALLVDAGARRAIEARYGVGAVRVFAALAPASKLV